MALRNENVSALSLGFCEKPDLGNSQYNGNGENFCRRRLEINEYVQFEEL